MLAGLDAYVMSLQAAHPGYVCEQCDFICELKYMLKRHRQRHDPENCKCTICGKTYKVLVRRFCFLVVIVVWSFCSPVVGDKPLL